MKFRKTPFSAFMLLCGVAGVSVLPSDASAQVNQYVNAGFATLNFGTPALQSGVDRTVGAVYKYTNLITVEGVQVDGFVEIEAINNATITTFDASGALSRFEPVLSSSSAAGGFVDYRISFRDTAGVAVALHDFNVTGLEVDGLSAFEREYHEIGGFTSYQTNVPTSLELSSGSDARLRFLGRTSPLAGLVFDDTASYIVTMEEGVSDMSLRLGIAGLMTNRDFAFSFGPVGGVFSDPVVVDSVAATLSTAATNSTVPFVVTAQFSEDVTAFDVSDVLVSGATVGTFFVVDANTYTFIVTPTTPNQVTVRLPFGAGLDAGAPFVGTAPSNVIDLDDPSTSIASAPASLTTDATGEFTFRSNEFPVNFECRYGVSPLPSSALLPFVSCPATFVTDALASGGYTLEVRTIDSAGNRDASPASHVWRVDVAPPQTFILSGPAENSNDPVRLAEFEFDSDEENVTYTCSVNGAAGLPCAADFSYNETEDGLYTLSVFATDEAGNDDPTPATRTYSFDTVAPQTSIVSGPSADSRTETAVFEFSSNESPVVYRCSLDFGGFFECDASETFDAMTEGPHRLDVFAVDASQNEDATPATYFWNVDTIVPETFITAGPPANTASASASFTFTSDESLVVFQCSVDGADFVLCDAGTTIIDVAEGTHTMRARAIDAAGNVDETPAEYSWNVDRTAPNTVIESGPEAISQSSTATFTFSASETPVSYQCSLDGGTFEPCNETHTIEDVTAGEHTLRVRAVDPVGNIDETPAEYSWEFNNDTDADGLTNDQEAAAGTDPTDADTDNDGLSDRAELGADGVRDPLTETDPLDADTDDDGLLDGDEVNAAGMLDGVGATDPLNTDTDEDGLPDGLEVGVALPIAGGVSDGQGIPYLGTDTTSLRVDLDPASTTDPNDVDSDGDGIIDGNEDVSRDGATVNTIGDSNSFGSGETDPNDNDSDNDGLLDGDEVGADEVYNVDVDTNPLDVDTDNGGISDGIEVEVGTNPLDPTDDRISDDADGDGLSTDDEEALGTDPNVADTDGDGISDGVEVLGNTVTDPTNVDSDGDRVCDGMPAEGVEIDCFGAEDANNDGVVDSTETDPSDADTDGGGVEDGDELEFDFGMDPLDPSDDQWFVRGVHYQGGSGAGCTASRSSAGGMVLFALVGLLLAVSRRRRSPFVLSRAAAPMGVLSALVLAAAPAAAQNERFDAQFLHPAPGRAINYIGAQSAQVQGHGKLDIALLFNYASGSFGLYDGNNDLIHSVVQRQLTTHVLGNIGLSNWLDVGVDLPLIFFQTGGGLPTVSSPSSENGGFGLGDLRLALKGRLVGPSPEDEVPHGFGLAIAVDTFFPTGDDSVFQGEGEMRVLPRIITEGTWRGGTRLVGNFGVLVRRNGELANVSLTDAFDWRVAMEIPIGSVFSLVPEVGGQVALAAAGGLDTEQVPVEALLEGKFAFVNGVTFEVGGGIGVNGGVGVPDWRALAGVGWHAVNRNCEAGPEDMDGFEDDDRCFDIDNDNDGIADVADACPNDAEDYDGFQDEDGCPESDNDGDGIDDIRDRCPLDPEDLDGFQDDDGCPDPDNDQDTIVDSLDRCPLVAEDFDGFEDTDGCPDPDNDGDGILDVNDECPHEPEDMDGNDDADGCPEFERVTVTCESIVIDDSVYFRTDEDVIEERSYELLNQVAEAMRTTPFILRVRVEGHTDDRGSDEHNQELSDRRAASVMNYLIGRGIAPERLESRGFGESAPIVSNDDSDGRAANRRVVFVIASRATDSRCTGRTVEEGLEGSDTAVPINDEQGE